MLLIIVFTQTQNIERQTSKTKVNLLKERYIYIKREKKRERDREKERGGEKIERDR